MTKLSHFEQAMYDMSPFRFEEELPRQRRGVDWVQRTLDNIRAALNKDATRQQLVSIIWRCIGPEMMDVIIGRTFQAVKELLEKDRLKVARKVVPGFKVYDLENVNENFRTRLGDLVWSLIERDVAELIDLKKEEKRRQARKK